MTYEQYLKQRNALLAEIENLIAEGKTEDADAKMKEVEALDEKWETSKGKCQFDRTERQCKSDGHRKQVC